MRKLLFLKVKVKQKKGCKKRDKVENEVQEDEQNWIVDSNKLQNLLSRRNVYGDITQNVSERQIKRLLVSRK